MRKKVIIISIVIVISWLVFFTLSSKWFLSLPFMPEKIRNNFLLNADILPANDASRSLFVTINPGFRAEFGDKDNLESAFLRFEVNSQTKTENDNADINRNLLDSFAMSELLFKDYHPGIEWQLFSVGIDEEQVFKTTELAKNDEIARLTQEMLGNDLKKEITTDIQQVLSEKKDIKTETKTQRFQGYDVVENMAVANEVDLKYTVVPGKGIKKEIVIGDRENFDTACLKLISLTGIDQGCDLPYNRFSFLLQLDQGQKLIHSPLSLDGGESGSYYIVDEEEKWLLRIANPSLIDAVGNKSERVKMELRKGEVGGEEIDNYYVVTLIADLNWLIDNQRIFPVKLEGGFYIDKMDLFRGENWNNGPMN